MRQLFIVLGVLFLQSCAAGKKQGVQLVEEPTQVSILDKSEDLRFRINGAWVLEKIQGKTLEAREDGLSPPLLEIRVEEMRYLGNDGCNNFNGGIIELDEQVIRFGVAAGTRMLCPEMDVPDLFNTSIPEVQAWEIKDNRLQLFDAGGMELMRLKKSD